MRWYHSGQFWMWLWCCVFGVMVVWGACTVLFWMDSTRNINALSVAANILAPMAGFQASLSMRKADRNDKF
jgi:hypothetical protein